MGLLFYEILGDTLPGEWDEIVGIEMEEQYIEIAERRILAELEK